jgi:succinate dehydrogenase / fumarate reductase membrane anchor subunit
VASAAFVLAVLLHAWLGMRDVVLDYVHRLWLRLLLLPLIGLLLTGSGLWAFHILLPVARQ